MTLWLDNRMQGWHQDVTSFPNFVDWRDWNETFDDMAGISFRSANITGDADPERVPEAVVSPTFFDVLQVAPLVGRGFSIADWDTDERLIVVSHGFWQQRYGSELSVLGSSLVVNGHPHTIVGVMPAGFQYMRENVQLWRLFDPGVRETSRGWFWLQVVGRLSEGITLEQARADMDRVGVRLEEEYASNTGYGVTVVSVHEEVVGDVRPALLVLLGAVGLVLLIACANVANLMVARASSREREIAIRSAIGATRGHLFHQLLVESVLLALIGGLCGLGLAGAGLGLLQRLEPELPRLAEIGLHPMVLLFTLAASLLTGLLFGVLPALHGSHVALAGSLKDRGTGEAGGVRTRRFRQSLVAAELALALVLLIGAGLLIRSYATLVQTTPGFEAENLLVFRVSLSGPNYQSGDDAIGFFAPLLERLQALPGVQAAAGVRNLPMSGSYSSGFFTIEGRPPVSRDQLTEVKMNVVTAGYFETMGVPVRGGRTFTVDDDTDGERVVVVNEALARTWFPDEDPVGQRFLYGFYTISDSYVPADDPNPELPWRRIGGVVGSTRQRRLETEPEPEVFGVYGQARLGTLYMTVRTDGEPTSVAAAARAAVWELDPNIPVAELGAMSNLIGRSTAARRFNLTLLALFAGVAVALAAIGIYGVISYWVSQQTREIGVRMALGARGGDVLRMIMRHTALVVAAGVGVGLVAAFGLTRLMASLLYGVGAADPLTFVLVASLLEAVAMGASFVPARRATRIDPIEALRED